jgi:hypothetical protein
MSHWLPWAAATLTFVSVLAVGAWLQDRWDRRQKP